MRCRILAFLSILFAACSSQPRQAIVCVPAADRLCPVDEGRSAADFDAFRSRLVDAVRARSVAELVPLVDPHVRTSFGPGGGIDAFKNPDSPLWPALDRLLALGGTFHEQTFWAPYVYSTWPEALDAFEHIAATRAGVPIRASASEQGDVVTTVDWKILKRAGGAQNGDWIHVTEGWVAARDVYSPVGYRAAFTRSSGQWRLTALVSGD